jgi:cell division protein ZapB
LTADSAANYAFRMSDNTRQPGAESELKRLEKRIDDLLASMAQLKEENRALRQRQEMLAGEKTALLNRNDQVRARVEAMIGRLKSMEHGA